MQNLIIGAIDPRDTPEQAAARARSRNLAMQVVARGGIVKISRQQRRQGVVSARQQKKLRRKQRQSLVLHNKGEE